jgi:hypothetical protein
LLPNIFGAPVYGSLERFVNARDGVGLHIRHQVRINVHRYRNAGMTETLLNDLRMYIRSEQVAGVAVPEPMEPNLVAAAFEEIGDTVRQAVGT